MFVNCSQVKVLHSLEHQQAEKALTDSAKHATSIVSNGVCDASDMFASANNGHPIFPPQQSKGMNILSEALLSQESWRIYVAVLTIPIKVDSPVERY